MIAVAIVEDEESYAKAIINYCRRYATEKQIELSARWFANPVDFLDKYRGEYDVVFMDVLMPLMDGMTCARRLRALDEEVILCFVTSVAQYAIHGYEVNAMDFIIKPITFEEFSMKLDRIFRLLRRRATATVMVNSRGSVRRVNLRDLYYVEVYNHSLIYHTADGSIEAYGKLAALEEDERFKGFIRVSNSHLVNAAQITAVREDSLLVNGETIPLSRRRRKECLEKMAALLGGMGV
ncbi:MAG: response regulator transcription factor [Clostridia bacterium]|nr:response regulator transcription factor [Clostridia bacterium]MBR0408257.1 response regulator transcription factor [Clostridia bacterium]